jgi:hypothetical protein
MNEERLNLPEKGEVRLLSDKEITDETIFRLTSEIARLNFIIENQKHQLEVCLKTSGTNYSRMNEYRRLYQYYFRKATEK